MKDLTTGKPLRCILLFAIPLFIGQLFTLCYSLVDTRIIGSTLSESALAAVGATITFSDLLTSLSGGLTNGFAIVIATHFGAKDHASMKKAIAGTVVLCIGTTLLLTILSLLGLPLVLRFLHVPSQLLPQATAYLRIILIGLLASSLYQMCAGILRAVGDSYTPLLFLIAGTILNIFLDYGFILGLHTGVAGAAYATVLAQVIAGVLCFLYMQKKYPELRLSREDFRISGEMYRRLAATGFSMSFMISFVTFGTLALQTSINTLGTNIIVAHTAARKLTGMFMLPFSVFGVTMATYCGQNLGANRPDRIRRGILDTLLVEAIWVLFVILIANTMSPVLITLITASTIPEVLDNATLYLRVDTAFYLIPAAITILRNSMQGFGDNRTPLISSALELIGKVLIALFLAPVIGYMGIIMAEPIVWIIMVIPLIVGTLRHPVFRSVRGKALNNNNPIESGGN